MDSELFAEYMAYLINNKKAPKQVKQAGLDNYWMAEDPKTKRYVQAPLESIKDIEDGGWRDDRWFRGKLYDDLVMATTNGSLYGMSHAPAIYDEIDDIEYPADKDGDYNWLTNKQCRKIYKKLRKLTPKSLAKLRKRFDGIYDIPDDEDAQAFIDQFGKHVDAGHSLYASW